MSSNQGDAKLFARVSTAPSPDRSCYSSHHGAYQEFLNLFAVFGPCSMFIYLQHHDFSVLYAVWCTSQVIPGGGRP